jgi:hypothetical protein
VQDQRVAVRVEADGHLADAAVAGAEELDAFGLEVRLGPVDVVDA